MDLNRPSPNAPGIGGASAPLVLLVDDDDDQQFIFQVLLEREGWTVITADSALEAQQTLNEVHVDLVLCDVNMPYISGKELVRRLRKTAGHAHLPIVSFSADATHSPEELLSCGADVFCTKEETKRLLREIKTLLDGKDEQTSLLEQVKSRFAQ